VAPTRVDEAEPRPFHSRSSALRPGPGTLGAENPREIRETETIVTAQLAQPGETASGSLYVEVQQFYARHMHLLDSGQAQEWAQTFAEDGTFDAPTMPEPIRGRAAIAAGVAKSAEERAAAGETQRHWHGMVDVQPRPDGALEVRCYALVFSTFKGQESRLHRVCVCTDVLVRVDGRLVVSTRKVTRDDL
jgi:3-phenylpropionate/cinnamic acid dioxygenase small subunit